MPKHLAPETEPAPSRVSLGLRRLLLGGGVVLVGIISIFAGYAIFQHKNPLQVITSAFVQTPQQVFGKDHLLILAVGLDYDYDSKDEEYSTQSRSDVIKAINLDFGLKKAYVVSVLRDMVATMPDGRQAKINEAQSDGGIKEAQSVIASFLGTPPFDRYIILRINAMKEIISAINGVDINVKDSNCIQSGDCKNQDSLNYDDSWGHLHIHLKPGMQHLDGPAAVGYARFRHDWCGDPCRSKRQEQVIQAMISKLRNDKFNTVMHIGQLIDIVRRNVTTNLTQGEMIALANYFSDVSPSDIIQAQLPYVSNITLPDGGDALVADDAAKKKLVQEMLIAPPTPQPSPDMMALASIPPGTIRIDVENGSGIAGAAHKVADALKAKGFVISDVGNATGTVAITEVHEHSKTTFAGAKVREALPARMQSAAILSDAPTDVTSASDVTVIVGKDLALSTSTPKI